MYVLCLLQLIVMVKVNCIYQCRHYPAGTVKILKLIRRWRYFHVKFSTCFWRQIKNVEISTSNQRWPSIFWRFFNERQNILKFFNAFLTLKFRCRFGIESILKIGRYHVILYGVYRCASPVCYYTIIWSELKQYS